MGEVKPRRYYDSIEDQENFEQALKVMWVDNPDEMIEYENKIQEILTWAKENKWFKTNFVVSVRDSMYDRNEISENQMEGIDNIYNKFIKKKA